VDLGGLGDALGGLAGTAGGLGNALGALGGKALGAASGLSAIGRGAGDARGALAATESGVDRLIGKRAALRDAVGGELGNALGAAQQLGGPLGNIASKVQNIASLFGRVPPQVGAVLIVVVALTAAITGTVAALYKMGEAAIDVVQKASMLRSVLGALHSSGDVGGKIQGLIDSLGTKLPFATEQIAGWAKGLSMVARSGSQLESMVKSVAAAQAIMGDSGAAAAQRMMETLARGGVEAVSLVQKLKMGLPESKEQLAALGLKTADLARALGMTEQQFKRAKLSADQMNTALQKALQQKGAGPLEELGMTFPVIMAKAKEGLLSLFDKLGPAVKPFMAAIKSLFGEFSKGGSVINTLKPIVTSVMTTVFAWATSAVNAIRTMVREMSGAQKGTGFFAIAIGALKVAWAALVQIWRTVSAALAPVVAMLKAIFTNAMVLTGLKAIFGVILGVIVAVVVAVAAFVAVLGTMAGVVSGAIAALYGLGAGALGAAADFVGGLVAGILGGAGSVADAVKSLASSALSAFTGALGINSPSTIMLEHGEENIAGAAAMGVEAGTPRVAKAMTKMGEQPAGTPKGGAAKGAGGSGPSIEFNDCTFIGTDESLIRRVMSKVWEELNGEAGSAVAT